MTESHDSVRALARARWKVAIVLTAIMVALYFGFILLVAYNKPLLGRLRRASASASCSALRDRGVVDPDMGLRALGKRALRRTARELRR